MSTTEATSIDLTKFCADEDTKYLRDHPYVRGRFRYACNGRIAIRVEAMGEADTDDGCAAPDIDSLINESAAGNDWQPWPTDGYVSYDHECLLCDGTGQVDRVECSTCKGYGGSDCPTCGQYRDCADCFGKGFTAGKRCPNCKGEPDSGELAHHLLLASRCISIKYGRLIETLSNVEWCADPLSGNDPLKPLGFRFTGGVGLIMPLNMEVLNA